MVLKVVFFGHPVCLEANLGLSVVDDTVTIVTNVISVTRKTSVTGFRSVTSNTSVTRVHLLQLLQPEFACRR